MNIGANPSAEGADADEVVDDQVVKVVDIVDTFRLQVNQECGFVSLTVLFQSINSFSVIVCRSNPLMTRSNLLHM